jgi:hypothetical protein
LFTPLCHPERSVSAANASRISTCPLFGEAFLFPPLCHPERSVSAANASRGTMPLLLRFALWAWASSLFTVLLLEGHEFTRAEVCFAFLSERNERASASAASRRTFVLLPAAYPALSLASQLYPNVSNAPFVLKNYLGVATRAQDDQPVCLPRQLQIPVATSQHYRRSVIYRAPKKTATELPATFSYVDVGDYRGGGVAVFLENACDVLSVRRGHLSFKIVGTYWTHPQNGRD